MRGVLYVYLPSIPLEELNSLKYQETECYPTIHFNALMAADTREDSSQQSTSAQPLNSSSIQDKTYEKFSAAPHNANALPGGSINTAGGKVRETKIMDALKTIKLEDFKDVYKKPCARDALLVGIGAGFGAGGLRAILGGLFLPSPSQSRFLSNRRSTAPEGL